MTNPHAQAVKAAGDIAAQWFDYEHRLFPGADTVIADAITAYLAVMRAEGWVMVRDVGEIAVVDADTLERMDGWNDCRTAILKEAGDGQG